MKAFLQDMRHALYSRWFVIAVFTTSFTLWLGLGSMSYLILHADILGQQISWFESMQTALLAQISSIALPALSALPFAANGFKEINSGVFRMASFRTSNRAYRHGKVAACGLSGMLVQLFAFTLFILILYLFYLYASNVEPQQLPDGLSKAIPFPAIEECMTLCPQFITRVVCAGAWSCTGGSIALLTQTGIAAYIGPLMISFCLTFISSRFLSGLAFIDSSAWGEMADCYVGIIFFFISTIVYDRILKREIKKHA